MRVLLNIWVLLIGFSALAQEKREVERRIKEAEVPEAAVNWIENVFEKKLRAQWYEEYSSGKLSYEAKFKRKGRRYSVEFDPNGNIEDIEIRTSINSLPETFRKAFMNYLDENYTRYKVSKIQEQWTGNSDALIKALHQKDLSALNVRYEIEFYGKNELEDELWEGLFEQSGELIQRKKIVLRPMDNLLY
jgi:hypothetical protein